MNCQEFRKAWTDETDIETLSHIETCEECIAWVEAQFTSGEEVQFLKEVPQPTANLEEKIMQAIYQTAGQGVPPHAASAPVTTSPKQAEFRRWTFHLPSLAWAGAAAILLAVGVAGYQQFHQADQGVATESAMQSGSAAKDEQKGGQPAAAQSNRLSPDTSVSSPAAGSTQSAPAEKQPDGQTAPAASLDQSAALAINGSATERAQADASQAQEPQAVPGEAAAEKAQAPQTPQQSAEEAVKETVPSPHKRPIIAARNASGKASDDQAHEENTQSGQTAPTDQTKAAGGVTAFRAAENESATQPFSAAIAADPSTESLPPVAGPPATALAKQEITLSTFTDLETAVQSSDMPVPVLNQLPDGIALQAVTVQYESPTSQKVVRLSADYRHGKEWIKVDVVPNAKGKRSLSIPGTFTATQLFTVNGEQAIAVSFDQQASSGEADAQHAVHFNAQAGNRSLYVVLTARGSRLDQLVEVSKQLTWR
jgi:hypothetical protein